MRTSAASAKQYLQVGVLCSFLWRKLWPIPEMNRDQALSDIYCMAGTVQGPTVVRGCIISFK